MVELSGPAPPSLTREMDAAAARRALTDAGWPPLAAGDWAWAHVSPDGRRVVRVTPWDDAYLLHARACLDHPDQAHLPKMEAIIPLAGAAYAVVIERLHPAEEADALAFLYRLGLGKHAQGDGDPALSDLRAILVRMEAEGRATHPFWGGFDLRPGNLMRDDDGVLKVIDPVYVAGPKIITAITGGDRAALSQLTPQQLAAFPQIAAFEREGGSAEFAARIAEVMAAD